MKAVLYLNQQHAVWTRFQGSNLVDIKQLSLPHDAGQFPCYPWDDDKGRSVNVILDTGSESITLHPLAKARSRVAHLSNQAALRRQLVDRYSNAIILTPAKSTRVESLIVQHFNISESMQAQLELVERGSLTIRSYTSVVECVALSVQCIVISRLLGSLKHTYCESGYALFARTLNAAVHNSALSESLVETYEHLRSEGVVLSTLVVYSIGLSFEELQALAELTWVSEVVRFEEGALHRSQVKNDVGLDSKLMPILAISLQVLQTRTLRLSASKRCCSIPLNKHATITAQKKKRTLQLAAASSLFVSVGLTASLEFDRRQRAKVIDMQIVELTTGLEAIQASVLSISPKGESVSRALFSKMALERRRGQGPHELLGMLATLFSTHRNLMLTELQWVVIDSNKEPFDVYQQGGFTPSARSELTLAAAEPSVVLVRLAGRSLGGLSLRDQQQAVDAIAFALNENSLVKHLEFDATPLSQAAQYSGAGLGASNTAAFSLQFQLMGPVANES